MFFAGYTNILESNKALAAHRLPESKNLHLDRYTRRDQDWKLKGKEKKQDLIDSICFVNSYSTRDW